MKNLTKTAMKLLFLFAALLTSSNIVNAGNESRRTTPTSTWDDADEGSMLNPAGSIKREEIAAARELVRLNPEKELNINTTAPEIRELFKRDLTDLVDEMVTKGIALTRKDDDKVKEELTHRHNLIAAVIGAITSHHTLSSLAEASAR